MCPCVVHLLPVDHPAVAVALRQQRSAARSLPASGSLNSWHQISEAVRIAGRWRRRCSSVPYWNSDVATSAAPTGVGAWRASSSS